MALIGFLHLRMEASSISEACVRNLKRKKQILACETFSISSTTAVVSSFGSIGYQGIQVYSSVMAKPCIIRLFTPARELLAMPKLVLD